MDRRGQIVLGYWDDTEYQREHGQLSHQERDAKARNDQPHRGGRQGYSPQPDRTPGTAGFGDAHVNMTRADRELTATNKCIKFAIANLPLRLWPKGRRKHI